MTTSRFWDDAAKVPWAWSPSAHGGHFISYDDPESIQLKMDYINDNNLGGAMFWEVTADREAELLDVIYQALEGLTPEPVGILVLPLRAGPASRGVRLAAD